MHTNVFPFFIKEAASIAVQKNLNPKETKQVINQLTGRKNLEKKASGMGVNALELGGLGILSVPGFKTLANRNASAHDKSHAKMENAGLGVLAAHPAYETANHFSGGRIGNMVSRGISKAKGLARVI